MTGNPAEPGGTRPVPSGPAASGPARRSWRDTWTLGAGDPAAIMVRGLFDRHALDVLVGAVMALCFAYQFTVLLPQQGVGWQAHIGGLAGGIGAGWVFRERRTAAPARRSKPGTGSGQPRSGPAPVIAPDNPRAALHKELDDLGL